MSERILFANSGIQLLCFPLQREIPGHDRWSNFPARSNGEPSGFEFVQWKSLANKLFLAVDTTTSKDSLDGKGYFCRESALDGDHTIRIPLEAFSVSASGEGVRLKNGSTIEFVIKPVGLSEGGPKDVDMVVDFGNNRTGALMLEIQSSGDQRMLMTPFELMDRSNLKDAWDEQGQQKQQPKNRWFSSRTHWCTPPFLRPLKVERTVHEKRKVEPKTSLFSRSSTAPSYETVSVQESFLPDTFLNYSMVRLGSEAAELGLQFDAGAEGVKMRTGLSSPKRYLWADDKTWLDNATWRMFDPEQRYERAYVSRLQGPLLQFFHEEDRDQVSQIGPFHKQSPAKPQYPPRLMMVAAIYELLCQAYTFIHSIPYRRGTGDALRMRQIRSLILSYPTGMTKAEQDCLKTQAEKACAIFHQTLGRQHAKAPEVSLSLDEASAVHFAYLHSEMEKTAMNPKLWFSIMARPKAAETKSDSSKEQIDNEQELLGKRRGRRSAVSQSNEKTNNPMAVRIACIDIGGGTSDLTIAEYSLQDTAATDTILGEIVHKNGLGTAGDQLVKRLLECIIVPTIADATNMLQDAAGERMAHLLFGLEVAKNASLRFDRINWMNQILVPIAEAYLGRAVRKDESPIEFSEVIAPEWLERIQKQVDSIAGLGKYNIKNASLNLKYDAEAFGAVVQEVFGELTYDFCSQIVKQEVDIVLLAGQPSKLPELQQMIRSMVPLHDARILPMHQYFAGPRYPYNSVDHRIEDPKSAVVVGTAAKYASEQGHLGGLEFRSIDRLIGNKYFWGTYKKERISENRVWFEPDGPDQRTERIISTELILGRRLDASEEAQATPVYVLKVEKTSGQINCNVTIRRERTEGGEETLHLVAVDGKVGDQPAIAEKNVFLKLRTLADESYYLDTGALNDIKLDWLDDFYATEHPDHV